MHKIYVNHYIAHLILTALFVLMTSGCVATIQSADPDEAINRNSRLIVLPFMDMAAIYGPGVTVRGPATHQAFVTGQVAEGATRLLSLTLTGLLATQAGLNWNDTAAGISLMSSEEMTNRVLHNQAIAKIGTAKGGDAALVGYIYAFEERLGSDYGVERPAKVVFELVLIQANTGQLIWQGRHMERQEPLSSNLMALGQFIQRKGRWVSAQQMAEQAMQKMLPGVIKALPY